MAKQLVNGEWQKVQTTVNFGAGGRIGRYPWDLWLNGRVWRLEFDEDFLCKAGTFRSLVATQQARRGMKIRTRQIGAGVIEVQNTFQPVGGFEPQALPAEAMVPSPAEEVRWQEATRSLTPWAVWGNGSIHTIEQGVHFDCFPEAMHAFISHHAESYGRNLRILMSEKTITFQFVERPVGEPFQTISS